MKGLEKLVELEKLQVELEKLLKLDLVLVIRENLLVESAPKIIIIARKLGLEWKKTLKTLKTFPTHGERRLFGNVCGTKCS